MLKKANIYDIETLRKRLEEENLPRKNLSFYRYVFLPDPQEFRDRLYLELNQIQVLGRIYVAPEGINAQISVPEENLDRLREVLESFPELRSMDLNFAVEHRRDAFLKLTIKIRKKIVADGLEDGIFDVTNVGVHVNGEEFNRLLKLEDTVCIDMRNAYEWEVGHFRGAILPDAQTFREELPIVLDILKDKKDKNILLYCTGGIRCEKASAYLKHHGYTKVYQLKGGIISYAQEMKEKNLPSEFIGKNFVFDERLGERITEDVLGKCHICGTPCDTHTNCRNPGCHVLMILCPECSQRLNGCCSEECRTVLELPESVQVEIRRKAKRMHSLVPYSKSRKRKITYLPGNSSRVLSE